jgi:hypothetical protein
MDKISKTGNRQIIYSFFIGTVTPPKSPITLTKSLSEGTIILALSLNASLTVSSLLSSCAFPTKYFSAASFTIFIASPSASAFSLIA